MATFFASAADLRKWLQKNHATADELWVGVYKKKTGKPSVTWPEVVDQALCFGWIDGIRRSIDDEAYMNRLTPRRPGSNWSAVNIRRAQQLIEQGLMKPSGFKAFAQRDEEKASRQSFEREHAEFSPAQLRQFKKNKPAWDWFQRQPPSSRKLATWWVISARQPTTQERRLGQLIERCAAGLRVGGMNPERKK
jgi:uncharacterized protein YdeI (YjbR/CyaY-like superfamily)